MPYVVIISSIIILPLIAYSFDFDNSLINGLMISSDSTLAGFIDYLCINTVCFVYGYQLFKRSFITSSHTTSKTVTP